MNKLVSIYLKLLMIIVLLIITGCSTNIYNTPYIDTIETMQLKHNLSKNEVINIFGKPLYVENGTQTNSEISWVYEVRARNVESNLLATGEIIPNKVHNRRRPSQPLNYLRIIFVNDKVSKWETFDKKKINIVNQKPTPNKIFFHPKIGFDIIKYTSFDFHDYYDYGTDNTKTKFTLVMGGHFGYETVNYRFGLDVKIIGQQGIFATIEKRDLIFNFNLNAGGGYYGYSVNEEFKDKTVISFLKIGTSKEIILSGQSTLIGLDLLFNDGAIYPAYSLAYKLK